MGCLLIVLAVVLVPIVAQTPTCRSAITQRIDDLNNAVINLNARLLKLETQERACARATVAEGLPLSLIINKTASFSVLVRDCGGYDLSTGGDNITVTLTCVDYPSLVSPQPTVVDNGDGSYQVFLSPECSGNNLVSVSINGKTIKDMPVTVAVIPLYTSLRLKRRIAITHPFDLDFSENGDVFVGSWDDHHVHHFDRSGKKLNSWRLPGNNVHGLLVYGNNVIVSQCNPPKVYNYTLSGVLVGPVFTAGCYTDLVVGPNGRLYAPDWISTSIVNIFNMADSSVFHQITGTKYPRGIGFDQDGNLHFGSRASSLNIVRVYTPSGVLVRRYTPPSAVEVDGIFIDRAGNRLICDRSSASSKLIITDKNNNLINKLPAPFATNAVITPNGDVWVTRANNNKVSIFSE